jgi:hypothetical protein
MIPALLRRKLFILSNPFPELGLLALELAGFIPRGDPIEDAAIFLGILEHEGGLSSKNEGDGSDEEGKYSDGDGDAGGE